MASHLEASLHHDIGQIHQQVRVMAELCDRALDDAVRALVSGERQPAYLVILRDHQIDECEQQLDQLGLEFLVRHQPAAGHLRFAYAALKLSSELERIGDPGEDIHGPDVSIVELRKAVGMVADGRALLGARRRVFMLMGEIVEHGRTEEVFLKPRDPRTADYVEGRYG